MKTIKTIINGRYDENEKPIFGEIRISEKAVTLMIPEGLDYYGICRKKSHKTYPIEKVKAALKHDGWASLEEIENSQHLIASCYLEERVKL